MTTVQTKTCYKCGKTKPLSEFHRARFMCKGCVSASNRSYYERHREEKLAYDVEQKLQRHYGISLAEYDAMLEAQSGGCAICGRTSEETGRRLSVDHDHETDKVRGVLCNGCNRGIGWLQSSSRVCLRAAQYLQSHGL